MDKRDILDTAKKYAEAINNKFSVAKVYLFGSYSKGCFNEHSDIDVAVVLDDYEDFFDIQVNLMYLTRKIDSRIEPHPFRIEDFNNNDPLAYEVLQHGIEIKIQDKPTYVDFDQVAEKTEKYITTK